MSGNSGSNGLVARNDQVTTDAADGLWLSLTSVDTDSNGYAISIASVGLTGTLGTVVLNPAATSGVYYAPGTAFAYLSVGEQATDSFTYTVSDGHGGYATATATVIVTGVNQAPVAKAETATTKASASVAVSLLSGVTDVNRDDVLSIVGVSTTGTKGSVTLGAGGVATYTPGAAFQYLAVGATATDSFGYTATDNHGATASGTATVTVTGTWQAPTAAAETAATAANTPVTLNILAGDSDPQAGQTLSLTALSTTGTKGSAVLNANGTVTYTPGAAFLSLAAGATAADTFGYTVSDSHGVASTGTETVTVTGVAIPPVANADSATTSASTGVWLNSTANDTDVKGYALAVVSVNMTGTKGTVTLNPAATNGVYYAPGTAFAYLSVGEQATDSFTYTISDGHGGTATATDTVTVTGVNQAPVATGAKLATTAPQPVTVNLLGSATDVNRDDTLSVAGVNTTGTKGSVTLSASGVATYMPGAAFQYLAAGATATDSFGYTVTDNHGATGTATDTVTVTGTWLPPVASADTATTAANASVTITVLANDSDPQTGQTLTVTSLNLTGTDGTAVINPNGTITYTPGAAFAGLAAGSASNDGFSYTVSDGHGGTATAAVKVTVTAPGASVSAPQAFYVATNGNDSWSGRLAAPNAAGTDGPLATLKAAQTAMEASTTTKTTYVEGGDYYQSATLTLGSADSGESWLGMPGQTAVIHGGQLVTGWVQGANGIWTAPAPTGSLASGSGVTDLFLNGTRETHARYPDASPANPVQGGWLTAAASLPGEATTSSFQFNAGDIPTLSSTAGLYVSVYGQNGWANYVLPVASINYTTDTVTLAGTAGAAIGAGSRYFLFNASSQLNATNEWYGDSGSNTISLDAPAGFNGTGVTVGSLANLIQVNGASNVTIAGLTLEGTASTGAAIRANSATGLTIAGDTITGVGNGVYLTGSGSGIDIEGNAISNTDDNGVLINPGTNNVTIKGNTVENIGQLLNGDGIWFTGSSNDTIANNLIENVANQGVGGGSVAGVSDASTNDVITANQIVDANQTTSDGGAIYLTGHQLTSTGDVITNNTISGTTATGTADTSQMTFLSPSQLVSYGIYLDDYASGVTVQGNLLTNNVGGILVHAGSNNLISDNTIVNGPGTALINQSSDWLNLASNPTGNVFTGNLVSDSQPGSTLAANLGDPAAASWTGNFYDVAGLSPSSFISDTAGAYKVQSMASWQAAGYDSGATAGVPGFIPGSYALAAGSAAAAAGITEPAIGRSGLAGFVATNPYDLAGR